jgi:hypothetical protein
MEIGRHPKDQCEVCRTINSVGGPYASRIVITEKAMEYFRNASSWITDRTKRGQRWSAHFVEVNDLGGTQHFWHIPFGDACLIAPPDAARLVEQQTDITLAPLKVNAWIREEDESIEA